ncbi:MAG: methyltransferase domain-containing protein [Henriciella sp.]|nr:methyltransferase domain-containing protein [Henriciella sp.]
MRQSAATLEAFYASKLGQKAADRIGERLTDLWGPGNGQRILGIGYTSPLLPLWQTTARACIGVVPEEIGETRLSSERGQSLCHAPEHRLPFSEGMFDKILLMHALEEAESPRQLLREAWRVMAPEGRIVVAVTNRRSLWSLNDAEPFGHGRAWTRRQMVNFLNDSLFQVTASTTAVHMPPVNWPIVTAAAKSWEQVGEFITPGLGGVVLVEAVKHLYAKPGGGAGAPVTQAVKAGKKSTVLPRKLAWQEKTPKPQDSAIDAALPHDTCTFETPTGAGKS